MERRRSKAFLITFIIVLILLVGGFFLMRSVSKNNSGDVAGETSGNKFFNSLFGSSRQKNVETVENTSTESTGPDGGTTTNTPSGTPQGPDAGLGSGSLGANNGSLGSGSLGPALNSLPVPTSGTPKSTPSSTITFGTSTTTGTGGTLTPPIGITTQTSTSNSICPIDDPLVFNENERSELEYLLRQYYLVATSLKNTDDIAVLENDIKTYTSLIDQSNSLTNQCIAQKSNPSYTGPQSIKENPYYQAGAGDPTYLPGEQSPWLLSHPGNSIGTYSDFETIFDIW